MFKIQILIIIAKININKIQILEVLKTL